MRIVLVCVGKFHDKKKEAGETDEADADVMPIELYHLLCAEFLKREFFLSWAWLTTGWNCVCRHDNIKSLAFHMFNITQDSIKTILITNLEREIHFYKLIGEQDSLLLSYKDEEIELLNDHIELYIDRLDRVDKWYNKPIVGAVGGVVGTIFLIKALNYTLPQ